MYLGFAGRMSQDTAQQFLWASDFFAAVQEHFASLHFAEIPDGLVVTFDSFPTEGPIAPTISRMRKVRNTTVRTSSGSLIKLATLYSANMRLSHSRLASCKLPLEVAKLIADEVEDQASAALNKLSEGSRVRFCTELRVVAELASRTPEPTLSGKSKLWKQ